jgi:hypothetical protein
MELQWNSKIAPGRRGPVHRPGAAPGPGRPRRGRGFPAAAALAAAAGRDFYIISIHSSSTNLSLQNQMKLIDVICSSFIRAPAPAAADSERPTVVLLTLRLRADRAKSLNQ